jgi:hypothetical protein
MAIRPHEFSTAEFASIRGSVILEPAQRLTLVAIFALVVFMATFRTGLGRIWVENFEWREEDLVSAYGTPRIACQIERKV